MKDWIYYSTLVEGYNRKYGFRGMRSRNRKLLAQLKKTHNEEDAEPIRRLLVENNLPLAMRTADTFCVLHHCPGRRTEVFQECILKLYDMTCSITNEEMEKHNYFQVRIYRNMYAHAFGTEKGLLKTLENTHERFSFDENDFPQQPEGHYDAERLKEIITSRFSERNACILIDYYFGNIDDYIEPFDTQMVAFKYNLSRGAVLAVKEKMIKKLRQDFYKHNLSIENFYIEQ